MTKVEAIWRGMIALVSFAALLSVRKELLSRL
jgi:hypothetical protein